MNARQKVAVITAASQGSAGPAPGLLGRGDRVVANSRSSKPDAPADVLALAERVTGHAVGEGRAGRRTLEDCACALILSREQCSPITSFPITRRSIGSSRNSRGNTRWFSFS